MDTEIASDGTGHTRLVALGLVLPVPAPKRLNMVLKLGGSPSSGGNVPIPRILYVPSNLGHPSAIKPESMGAHDTGYETGPVKEAQADKARTAPIESSVGNGVRLVFTTRS